MSQKQNGAPQAAALTPYQERQLATREQMGAGEPVAIVPKTFAEAMEFAKALAQSSLVPAALRDNPYNTAMMILAGAEIGIPPIASMRVFHVIEGVPKLSADGIAAICMRHPSCEYLEPRVQSATRVVWAAKKVGRPEVTLEVTREDMKAAGLWDRKNRDGSQGNHQKYPRQMLNARCKAELCRMVWPHLVAGMVSSEETADELGIDIHSAIDAHAVEVKSSGLGPLPTNANAASATKTGAPVGKVIEMRTETRSDESHDPPIDSGKEGSSHDASGPVRSDATDADAADDDAAADANAQPPPGDGPLSDEDVAKLADDMRFVASERDGRALSRIAADIAKLGDRVSKVQRSYLQNVYKKCSAELKGAAT